MRNLAMKMLGATTGILFAGAGAAAAYPTLMQARADGGAANQVVASVAAGNLDAGGSAQAGASAQAQAGADLSAASRALSRVESITRSRAGASGSEARQLYVTAAGKLADAAHQAEAMTENGVQAGASTLSQVASAISGEVTSLTLSAAAGFQTTMSAVPDVSSALASAAAAAGTEPAPSRTPVMDLVNQAGATLGNLVAFTPPAGGSATVTGSWSGSASGSGAGGSASISGSLG